MSAPVESTSSSSSESSSGLSADQVVAYQRDGFVSPIDLFTEDEVGELREEFERLEHDHPEALHAENRNNAHVSFPLLADICYHPTVVAAVQSLLGPDLVLWGTVLFIKEAGTAGFVSWHQDARYMGLTPHDFTTPWIALTPSTLENGCMSMIPGSHKPPLREHTDTFADDNILTRGQEVSGMNQSLAEQAVHLELRAGQMSIHHPRIIHGSQPNPSDDRRIGFAIQSYVSPDVVQELGRPLAMAVAGDRMGNFESIPRPVETMSTANVELRQQVNDNYAEILYRDAAVRRKL